MRLRHYILVGRAVESVDDPMTWARWFDTADRMVAKDEIDGVLVITVFLGLDHNFFEQGPPILFETMIFDNPQKSFAESYCERYSSWTEAEAGHAIAVAMVTVKLKMKLN